MKHFIYIFAGLICYLITLTQGGSSPLEKRDGEIANYRAEYPEEEPRNE